MLQIEQNSDEHLNALMELYTKGSNKHLLTITCTPNPYKEIFKYVYG
jgi:hypothetical protein